MGQAAATLSTLPVFGNIVALVLDAGVSVGKAIHETSSHHK
jgi:hypothetical protein